MVQINVYQKVEVARLHTKKQCWLYISDFYLHLYYKNGR